MGEDIQLIKDEIIKQVKEHIDMRYEPLIKCIMDSRNDAKNYCSRIER